MNDNQPTIQIEIGELMLHGFAPNQRHAIGAAMEQELARLVGERGWTNERGAGRLNAGSFDVGTGAPEQIGARIAAAVYGACGGHSE